ncbi:MAG: hypothetical protein GX219_03815 [Tissierellia bacterium]|nr:hypothetical protein [Tissierellia bacterium]
MEINTRMYIEPMRGIGGVKATPKYDPRERSHNQQQGKESFEEKRKEAQKKAEEKRPLKVKPQGYQYTTKRLNIHNTSLHVEAYDFLSEDNIQTVAFNFVISLRVQGKKFSDTNDNFVVEKRSGFFGEYGEKLINLECDKREAEDETGDYYGLDEIISVKKDVYKKLNDYLESADIILGELIQAHPSEWKSFYLERDKPNEIREFKIVSIKENFFVKKIKEEIKKNGLRRPPDQNDALEDFLSNAKNTVLDSRVKNL